MLGLFLMLALTGPFWVPFGENQQIYENAGQPPSSQHWFGTDNLGRDVFSRVVLGTGEVLTYAGLGTALAVALGLFLGMASGYIGGWFDEVLMRLFDSLLSIPAMLLALLMLGVLGTSAAGIWLVLAVVYTPIVARVVRSATLAVKPRGFVEAARLQGEPALAVLLREILPHIIPTLVVEAALRFSYAIFLAASLGFLGVGVQPPSPNWGLMVSEARPYADPYPWMLYFPAAAIALLVIAANLTADGLRRFLLREG